VQITTDILLIVACACTMISGSRVENRPQAVTRHLP
jgi:hypothetical protein